MKLLVSSISIFFCFTCFLAQNKEDFQLYKEKYKGYNYVQTLRKESIRIDLEKNEPHITQTYVDEFMVLTSQGAQAMSDDYFEFSPLETVSNVEAYSLIPGEKSFKKVKATGFHTGDAEQTGSIFHDGSKRTSMVFQSLTEGAYRHLSYSVSREEYRFPFGMYFASGIPIVNAVYEIDHDTSIHLSKAEFNTAGIELKFEEVVTKNRRIWRWTRTNIDALKSEDHSPRFSYYAPSVFNQISHINLKSGKTNILSSLQDLYDWYVSTVTAVIEEPLSDELSNLAKDLTKDKTTNLEKVRAIYYWVQDNIKYIAFEEGVNGYIPRRPSLVYEKRYGDCKDMATLIRGMSQSVGVNCYIAWIGSRDLPYKYSVFPSSIVDNHMIAIYEEDNQFYFLDATSSFQPISYPTGFIQDKEALLYIDKNKYKLITVPTPSYSVNAMIDTTYISIEDRRIKGNAHTELRGFYNIYMNERFKDVPEDKLVERMGGLVKKGNNSFKLTDGSVKNVSEREKDLHLYFDFQVDNYVTSYQNEVYLNMVLEKEIAVLPELKDRKTPLEFEFLSHDSYTVAFPLSSLYKVKSIPKNVEYNSDIVNFSVNYVQQKDTIYMTLNFDVKKLLLHTDQFSQWNDFVKIMKKAISETVVLTK